jgi:hypothetical protein
MPNPRAIEAIAGAAAKGAGEIGERLFGDTFSSKLGQTAEKSAASIAAKPGSEALRQHIRASLLGNPEQALSAPSEAAQRQLARAIDGAGETKLKDVRVRSGSSFVEREWTDRVGGRVKVVAKDGPKMNVLDELPAEPKAGGPSALEPKNLASVEKVSSPAVITKPAEPVMPTKAFELPRERKIVSSLQDGTVITEYTGAPLPFKFPAQRGQGVGSYGEYASTVKQLPDGSVTLGNPEGIDRIGRAFEKAVNTNGLSTPILDFKTMPNWFKNKFDMADSGVPAWFRGDSSWIYGQVNGSKLIKPVEANFDRTGALMQIRYEQPTKVSIGPFEGLVGNAMGITSNGDALLVNTTKIVGDKPQTFVFRNSKADIETWRAFTGANSQEEIRRVLLTPRAFFK